MPGAQRVQRGIIRPDLVDGVIDLRVRVGENGVRLSRQATEECNPTRFVIIGSSSNVHDPEPTSRTATDASQHRARRCTTRKGMTRFARVIGRVPTADAEGFGINRDHAVGPGP